MLKKFTGFKGLCAFAEVGNVQFVLLAKNRRELETLWNLFMSGAGPLDPAGCKKAILVEAPLLTNQPGQQSQSGPTGPMSPISSIPPIDV